MNHDLVGYLLGSLSADEHESVARALAESEELRSELDRIRTAMAPLEELAEEEEPPALLAERTAHRIRRMQWAGFSMAGTSGNWRPVDIVVAASILFVLSLVLLPALNQSRHAQRITECGGNLRSIGLALRSYADHYTDFYPQVAQDSRLNMSGITASMLIEQQLVNEPNIFLCAGLGGMDTRTAPTSLSALENAMHDLNQLGGLLPFVGGDYAYSMGVVIDNEFYAPKRDLLAGGVAIADRPPVQAEMKNGVLNSPNHGGGAINVLFQDGHVQQVDHPFIGPFGNNIYLNEEDEVGPGRHWNDPVLGAGGTRLLRN